MNVRAKGSGRQRTRSRVIIGVVTVVVGLLPAMAAYAGPIGTNAGFEDDDGNLGATSTTDWNSFAPVTWNGSAPYQNASDTANGWTFTGLTDDQKSNTDTGFGGGVKQDKDCPTVSGGSAPNKDDLKRAYVASKTVPVNGHDDIFLELAWVRIPQNTTSPSAHVGFEFNQGATACASGGLVQRTAGDMLIVYDFEGSSTSKPTLTVRRWVTTGSCEISSDKAPCWGPALNLTDAGYAEAKVNTDATAPDTLAPGAPPDGETLGLNEFGEAGIDLSAAGIFRSGCTAFGQMEAVSRSSGNSGQAAMEDLVGPGAVNINNCLQPAIASQQKVSITDYAVVGGYGTPVGTVDFQLFKDDPNCTTTPVYQSLGRSLSGGKASSGSAVLTTDGIYYWLVTYNGDANNAPSSSACGTERTTISGNTTGIVP